MTVAIGSRIIQLAEPAAVQVTSSLWQGRKVFAGVVPPQYFPRETGFRDWANLLDDRLAPDGYMVFAANPKRSLTAASAIQEATGKPAIVRLLVGDMKEAQLVQVRDEAAKLGINGFLFALGEISSGVTEEDALALFAEDPEGQKPLLACSVPVPSARTTKEEAMKQLAERINLGCQIGLLSPWVHPEASMPYLKEFEETRKISLPGIMQGIFPLENVAQWHAVKHGCLAVSDRIRKSLDKVQVSGRFLESSIEVEVGNLKASYEKAEGITHLGACVDMSGVGDEAMEDIMQRVQELTVSLKN